MRQRRRTGDSGLRLGARSPMARLGAALFVVAIILEVVGLAVAAAVAAHRIVNLAVVVIGGLLASGGAIATVWAQRAMGDSWRIGVDVDEQPALVTSGPFRWVRNPIFTGMAATQLGLAIAVPTAWTIFAAVLFVASIQVQVRLVEEPHLDRSVAGWASYAATVGRFVPSLGRREEP